SLESDYVAWFDNDCIVIGNIEPYLRPLNGEFQIRLRRPRENAAVFRNHYAPGESHGPVPSSVLAEWRKDVDERREPRIFTKCVANCFVLHRRHRAFLERWRQQNDLIFPSDRPVGVVDHANRAYFMTDESVLSSLLTFAHETPPMSDFRFDKDAGGF